MMTQQLKLLSPVANFEVLPGTSPRGGSLASILSLCQSAEHNASVHAKGRLRIYGKLKEQYFIYYDICAYHSEDFYLLEWLLTSSLVAGFSG